MRSITTHPKLELPGPPPCFHYASCGRIARIEKQGKSLCPKCAENYRGAEFPLREPMDQRMYQMTYGCGFRVLDQV